MPLPDKVKLEVLEYATSHLGDEAWFADYFDFVEDSDLADRLVDEFRAARFVYKVLEGLSAEGWLLRTQVRMQVLQYASIYEAVIHYLLFDKFAADTRVQQLTAYPALKRISVPQEAQAALNRYLSHNGTAIIPTYQGVSHVDVSKVRFDAKAACAHELGLIDASLMNDLVAIYDARNAIQIHAEIRKSISYELGLGKLAYRRMQPFREKITERLSKLGLYKATP